MKFASNEFSQHIKIQLYHEKLQLITLWFSIQMIKANNSHAVLQETPAAL